MTSKGFSLDSDNLHKSGKRQTSRGGNLEKSIQEDPVKKKIEWQKLKSKFINEKPTGIHFKKPESQCQAFPKVGDNIELLCEDSGLRGCWFRCKVVKSSEMILKVKHNDVQDVQRLCKLEEWVPTSRLAVPDRLRLRHFGRHTIRPWPLANLSNFTFEVGQAVDTWWCDGWWEGVVIGSLSTSEKIHVYLPGEDKFLTRQKKDVRTSGDWIDNRWVNIKPKPEVISVICSSLKPKPAASSTVKEVSNSGPSADEDMEKTAQNLKQQLWITKNEFDGGNPPGCEACNKVNEVGK